MTNRHCQIKDTSKMSHPAWNRGLVGFMKGKTFSQEHKDNIANALKGIHSWWKGGVCYNPYALTWTSTLKRSIRERDGYRCQICGKEHSTIVHHIDYDKHNSNISNLITVCKNCHAKTNHDRIYWSEYCKALLTINKK